MSSSPRSATQSRGNAVGIIPVAPEAWVFAVPAALFAAAFFLGGIAPLGWLSTIATLYIIYFFRDPRRVAPEGEHLAVAPADGIVTAVEDVDHPGIEGQRCRRISIFLSVFDVHINRTPLAGRVLKVEYRPGEFRNAMDASSAEFNERADVLIETSFGPLLVRQISGLIARRIICRAMPGRQLDRGERYGLIRFGSRTDVFLPLEAQPHVKPGQRVWGGQSIIAEFPRRAAN